MINYNLLLMMVACCDNISMYSRNSINILRNFLREHRLKFYLLQLSYNIYCKNVVLQSLLGVVTHGYAP